MIGSGSGILLTPFVAPSEPTWQAVLRLVDFVGAKHACLHLGGTTFKLFLAHDGMYQSLGPRRLATPRKQAEKAVGHPAKYV